MHAKRLFIQPATSSCAQHKLLLHQHLVMVLLLLNKLQGPYKETLYFYLSDHLPAYEFLNLKNLILPNIHGCITYLAIFEEFVRILLPLPFLAVHLLQTTAENNAIPTIRLSHHAAHVFGIQRPSPKFEYLLQLRDLLPKILYLKKKIQKFHFYV